MESQLKQDRGEADENTVNQSGSQGQGDNWLDLEMIFKAEAKGFVDEFDGES